MSLVVCLSHMSFVKKVVEITIFESTLETRIPRYDPFNLNSPAGYILSPVQASH